MANQFLPGETFRLPTVGRLARGSLVFDTSLVGTHERPLYWSEVGRELFGGLAFSGYASDSFAGRVVVHGLGAMTMFRTDATTIVATKSVKASRLSAEGFNLRLQLSGHSTVVLDDEMKLGPGDLLLSDNQSSFHINCSGDDTWAIIMVTIPWGLVHPYTDRLRRVIGVPMSSERGTGGVVRRLLTDLDDTFTRESVGLEASHVAQSVLELVLALCLQSESARYGDQIPPHELLLDRVKVYIEEHLGDPELHPRTIARDHFISVRLLYKLFESDGISPVQWIRARRLERCCRDLADVALAAEPITRIASNWGFTDPAHFSRLFRSRTGLSPTKYRSRSLAACLGDG